MKRQLLLLILPFLIFISCSKSGDPTPQTPTPTTPETKFKINDITTNSVNVVSGQRVILSANLSDSTGNIFYDWKFLFNNTEIPGTALSGLDLKRIKLNTDKDGEYIIRLTITRGSNDKSTFDKKISSKAGNFQYGNWGDLEETIRNSETDNGYKIYPALVGIPKVTENNQGLTTLTYEKGTKLYSYYFKSGKLYAGAYTTSTNYVNSSTDLRGLYSLFYAEKDNLEKMIGVTLTEDKTWRNTPDQILYWDSTALTRSQAIGLNYLSLKASGKSNSGNALIELYKQSATRILFSSILISPN